MKYINRDIEKDVIKWLDSREIIAIRGPRQSGKTTLIKWIAKSLSNKGINESQLHYINFEDDLLRIKFQESPNEFIKSYISDKKDYFLLDEVQYVENAGKLLKLIFDSYDDIKIIITGSSSFDLTNLGKYLVGRIIFFNLYPFSFKEFLRAKNERYERLYNENKIFLKNNISSMKIKKSIIIEELNELLHEYLTYGSYPRVVMEPDTEKKKELIKNLFITYVEKDIVSLYGKRYRDNSVKLLKALASMLSGTIKYETLSINSGLKFHEVTELLPLLEDSFVIGIMKPFYKNLINELRKNPKIYFIDYGFRNYLLSRFNNLEYGQLYENFVYNQLMRDHIVKFWRTTAKTEVDFIVNEEIPIEAKSSGKVTRALRSFISTYQPRTAFVANINIVNTIRVDSINLHIVPFVYF